MTMKGIQPPPLPLTYYFTMFVFHRFHRDIHHRPVINISLEQAILKYYPMDLKVKLADACSDFSFNMYMPVKIGLFRSRTHFNFGDYKGELTPQAAKKVFFEILGQELGISG